MRRDRIQKLIEVIKAEPEHFDFQEIFLVNNKWLEENFDVNTSYYAPGLRRLNLCDIPTQHSCGTLACIAGTAFMLWKSEMHESALSWQRELANILDISTNTAWYLATNQIEGKTWKHAIARLEWLLEYEDFQYYEFDNEAEANIEATK